MNEQIVILFFLILFTTNTLVLNVWKAKKQMEYRGDERWKTIQYRAIKDANYSVDVLALVLGIASMLTLYSKTPITLTLTRAVIYGLYFIGFRNTIELVALLYLDKQM